MVVQRGRADGMATVVWVTLLLLQVLMVGCQLGIGMGADPTPHPLPAPTPTLEERRVPTGLQIGNNTKEIDGGLHVWYVPCPPSPPAAWVASIILTDLRSGSHIYLNRDGSVKESPEPVYLTEEGQATLEAALKDSTVMEQIVARPECPERR